MADYFDGYDAGLDAGWGAGKTKAYQEILWVLSRRHSDRCCCRPCLVIGACRGDIEVSTAMRSIIDIDEDDEASECNDTTGEYQNAAARDNVLAILQAAILDESMEVIAYDADSNVIPPDEE